MARLQYMLAAGVVVLVVLGLFVARQFAFAAVPLVVLYGWAWSVDLERRQGSRTDAAPRRRRD
jgi:hypothetical protein